MGRKVGFIIVSSLIAISFSIIASVQQSETAEKLVARYKSDPEAIIKSVKTNLEREKYFEARYEIDRLIPSLPEDETLKSIRHQIVLEELRFNGQRGKLYLFDQAELSRYKELMGESANLTEVKNVYISEVKASVRRSLDKEDTIEATLVLDRMQLLFPENDVANDLIALIDAVKKDVEAKEAALARERAKQEATKRAAAQRASSATYSSSGSGGGMSRVVGKVGSLIYLANGETFAIERPTMLHIDGQIYPKGSGNPDYIQVGYRCRFTGEKFNVAEVFCNR